MNFNSLEVKDRKGAGGNQINKGMAPEELKNLIFQIWLPHLFLPDELSFLS
jgi:hypothetical protein